MSGLDDVKLSMIEAKAGAIVDMGGRDSYSPYVVMRLADETLELAAEVRRLRKIEAALVDGIAWKKTQAGTTRNDAKMRYFLGDFRGSMEKQKEARAVDAERFELERLLEGRNIA